MSKRLPTGADRLNFTLALLGFLNQAAEQKVNYTAGELAEHFQVSLADINQALRFLDGVDVQRLSAVHSFEDSPYIVYWDFEDEDDMSAPTVPFDDDAIVGYSFSSEASVTSAPQFSAEQVTALVTGLQYLRSLPDDSASEDIDELIKILTAGRHNLLARQIEYRPGTTSAVVDLIQNAIANQKRISCSYTNQKGETSTREMDPLRIDPRNSAWQLRSWCHVHNEPRSFGIERMSKVEILDQPWCQEAIDHEIREEADYISRETDVEVTVDVDPEGYDLIADFGGKAIKTAKETGTTRAVLKIGFLPYFGRAVARYGGAVRVIEPASAREIVRDYALNALKLVSDRKTAE